MEIKFYKKGQSIHIKKSHRGFFTEYCGGKVTDECILKAKKSKNSKLVKKAVFAENARKWKHLLGGLINNGILPVINEIDTPNINSLIAYNLKLILGTLIQNYINNQISEKLKAQQLANLNNDISGILNMAGAFGLTWVNLIEADKLAKLLELALIASNVALQGRPLMQADVNKIQTNLNIGPKLLDMPVLNNSLFQPK